MNAERVHIIAASIQKEAQEQSKLMGEMLTAFAALVDEPTDADLQKKFVVSRTKLESFLAKSVTNDFSPAWREALDRFDIHRFLGSQLAEKIKSEFDANQMTPAIALEELKQLAAQVEGLSAATNSLMSGFEFYEIDKEELEPGECELGFLIPRQAVGNRLKDLGEEFKDIEQILGPFAELATGSRPAFEVRSLSTSDFGLNLFADPKIAACVALAVSWITSEYKKILEIRKLRDGLMGQGLTKDKLKPVEDHASGMMSQAIGKATSDLLDEFGKNFRPERQRELTIAIKCSLTEIAKRIDKGYNIDVRAEPPKEGEESDAATEDGDAKAIYFSMIGKAQKDLRFIHHDGSPILSLTVETPPKDTAPEAGEDAAKASDGKPGHRADTTKKKAAPKRQRKPKKTKPSANK